MSDILTEVINKRDKRKFIYLPSEVHKNNSKLAASYLYG